MSDLKDNAIILTGSKLIIYSASIITGMMLVRYLSKHEYGSFLQINLVVGSISALIMFGIPSSIFYFAPKLEYSKVKGFMYQTVLFLTVVAFLSSTLLFFFRNHISYFINNRIVVELIYILIILLFIATYEEYIEPFYISTNKAIRCAKINMIFFMVRIITIISLLVLGYRLYAILVGIIAVSFLKICIVYADTSKLPGRAIERNIVNSTIKQFKFAAPIGFSRMVTAINVKIDQFMISTWFTPSDFAIYGRGAFNLPFVSLIVDSVSNVTLPKLVTFKTQNQDNLFLDLWHKSIKKVTLITYPLIAFFLFFSTEVFIILFTKEYVDSAIIFCIYLTVQFFVVARWGNLHIPHKNTKAFIYANIIAISINIFLNYVLYLYIGFYGPALGSVIARMCGAVFHLIYSCNAYSIKLKNILPWKYLFITLIVSMSLSAVACAIKKLFLNNFCRVGVGAIFFICSYVFLMSKLNIMTKEDRDLIFEWVNPRKVWAKIFA